MLHPSASVRAESYPVVCHPAAGCRTAPTVRATLHSGARCRTCSTLVCLADRPAMGSLRARRCRASLSG
eukprot:243948-Prymnesium_polylepis.1